MLLKCVTQKDGYRSLSSGMGHRTEDRPKRKFSLEFPEILRHGQAKSLINYHGKQWLSEEFKVHRHS